MSGRDHEALTAETSPKWSWVCAANGATAHAVPSAGNTSIQALAGAKAECGARPAAGWATFDYEATRCKKCASIARPNPVTEALRELHERESLADRCASLDAENARLARALQLREAEYAEALKSIDDNARAATHEGARAERLRVALEALCDDTFGVDQATMLTPNMHGYVHVAHGWLARIERTRVEARRALAEHARQPVPAVPACGCDALVAALERVDAALSDKSADRIAVVLMAARNAREALKAHRARPVVQAGEGGDNG